MCSQEPATRPILQARQIQSTSSERILITSHVSLRLPFQRSLFTLPWIPTTLNFRDAISNFMRLLYELTYKNIIYICVYDILLYKNSSPMV
jgi:hypothetical protein